MVDTCLLLVSVLVGGLEDLVLGFVLIALDSVPHPQCTPGRAPGQEDD